MNRKIRLGISSCLLGENVRYDGGHKLDHCLKDTFGKFVEWVPVCPEVECGLGIPREAMHLIGTPESPRLVTRDSNIDYTEKMLKWAAGKMKQLERKELCGFVFKSDSPNCGLNSVLSKKGIGIFAKTFTDHFTSMPSEDNSRLRDAKIRENFIRKIYAFRRIRNVAKISEI
jgi:uncharacterized protein YbbK (DUF523 family)